jgi:eukaryotic-like serine/threonine-protein kinase
MRSVSGSGSEETLSQTGGCDDVSRDGRFLLYESKATPTQLDLWVLPLTGERKAVPFVRTEADEQQGAFSPDGRFVAYASNTTGRHEVYVRAFPGGEGPWQVSIAGGYQPRWRGDGRELFYVSPDGHIMVVSVKGGGSFGVEKARPLFALRTLRQSLQGNRNDYDVTPDGQRFLANELAHDPAKATITVVVNWTSKLER